MKKSYDDMLYGAMDNIKVKSNARDKIIKESKDTEYEQWLFMREKRAAVNKKIKIIIIFSIFLLIDFVVLADALRSNLFINDLVTEGNFIELQYYENKREYQFYGMINDKKLEFRCSKSLFYESGTDTMKFYYIDGDEENAVPEFTVLYWVVRYTVIVLLAVVEVYVKYRSAKKIIAVRRL